MKHFSFNRFFLLALFAFCPSLVFAGTPKRVVALSPSAAEILCAVGAFDQIAAVSEYCDYPSEITSKPVCGGFDGKSLSLETIVSFNPDLVYLTKGMHDHLEKPLNQLGIKTYMSQADNVQSVIDEILEIGKLTGHTKNAQKVAKEIESDLKKISSKNSSAAKSVYWEVWYAPYMSAGGNTFISDVISKAGGKNIFDAVSDAYPIVSEESIIAAMPEVIIIPMSSGISVNDVKARKGWEIIPAVKNDRIFIVDDNLFTRPGPRIGKVALELDGYLSK